MALYGLGDQNLVNLVGQYLTMSGNATGGAGEPAKPAIVLPRGTVVSGKAKVIVSQGGQEDSQPAIVTSLLVKVTVTKGASHSISSDVTNSAKAWLPSNFGPGPGKWTEQDVARLNVSALDLPGGSQVTVDVGYDAATKNVDITLTNTTDVNTGSDLDVALSLHYCC